MHCSLVPARERIGNVGMGWDVQEVNVEIVGDDKGEGAFDRVVCFDVATVVPLVLPNQALVIGLD